MEIEVPPFKFADKRKNMDIRKSSYTISVKLDDTEDKYMLIHGYTGAVDLVNEKVIRYLENADANAPILDTTVDALKVRGYLTTKTEEEERERVRKLAHILHQKDKILFKHFMFLVAYDCNFRCPYCYEKKVLKNSRQWTKKIFSKEMVDKAYNAISKIGGDRRLHSRQITLYGGEPLLEKNKDIVEYIVTKGTDLGYRFMAITNGYDLNHFVHLLGPDKICTLQVTLDGIKEHHDKRRVHYRTKKSFDKIITNIGMALTQDVRIGIRVNTDADNFADLEKLEQMFRNLGYTDNAKLSIHSALLFDHNPLSTNKSLSFLDQQKFNDLHKHTNYRYNCTITSMAQLLVNAIKNNKTIDFSSEFCAAQSGSYILDPFGEIYACWEEVGHQEKIIGHYNELVEWMGHKDLWHNQNIASNSKCISCRYAFFCKGGCISQEIVVNGTFGAGFCNHFPDTFHSSVNLAYRRVLKKS
ncbi:MAG: SPASM domain-containing protein [Odoribacteraceae bacterium]|nr:SPASM domain-containing protein [Odoribacteraceae bacterium]